MHAIDAANPRTRMRALPAGHLSRQFVVAFVVVSCAIFVFGAWQFNRLTLLLSPVALAVRNALLLHQALHPLVAPGTGIRPRHRARRRHGSPFAARSIRASCCLTAAVTFWVGGFDVLYACQDYEFDRDDRTAFRSALFRHPHALLTARFSHPDAGLAGRAGAVVHLGWESPWPV